MKRTGERNRPPGPSGEKARLIELATLFLKLGTLAFGGPAAHIAMMEDEVVRRRNWLSRAEFLDLIGAVNLIPGPNSTEMAIHIGARRAGWPGLLVAGTCFILPATAIVGCIAWAYVRFGTLPAAEGLLLGIKPVIIAIVVQALWGLGRQAVKSTYLALICLADIALGFSGVHELALLFGSGLAMIAAGGYPKGKDPESRDPGASAAGAPGMLFGHPILAAAALSGATAVSFSIAKMFFVFLKIGAVLFGSGYVLLAFLRADFVERLHWLTESQLLDAVAVGQFTPGPVFTTATFIGYLLAGPAGAVAATIGIFLPAFCFVALLGPLLPFLRSSRLAGRFLDGINAASLALMGVVALQLGFSAFRTWYSPLLFLISLFLLFRYKVNSAWLVLGGAALGLAIRFFHP